MVEQFHVGQRVRLKRTLATSPRRMFQRGATGTVTAVEGIMVWMRMDQHFPHLSNDLLGTSDNTMMVRNWEITARPIGRLARLRAAWRGE
jgi:hypothetical protein